MQYPHLWKDLVLPGLILLALDYGYLTLTKSTFEIQIAAVQRVSLQFRVLGAIVCYALLIFGLYFFILRTHRSPLEALLFGIIIYGVYDSTNYATLKKWKWEVAVMDTLWGGVLLALTTMIVYKLVKV